ncbi:MAG: hypothetical protein Q9191_000637 [Dirinaria sp. TL-2023a]
MKPSHLVHLAISCLLSTASLIKELPSTGQELALLERSTHTSVAVIHQFPHNTWIENLAIRPNGQVLVTTLTSPDLYLIDPFRAGRSVLVHSFSDHLCLLGIAELQPDVFYVITGNYSQRTNANPSGAWDVYSVDMRAPQPKIGLSGHFPDAILLNGMAVLNSRAGFLLIGDAGAGIVYRLNVHTGAIAVVLDDPLMKPPRGGPVGIDGLQIRHSQLYWTNAGQGLLIKTPLYADGRAAGPSTMLMKGLEMDDLALDTTGDAFLAVTYRNEIVKWSSGGDLGGTNTVIRTSQGNLVGPTACKFGRTLRDSQMLYVSTNGGLKAGNGSRTPGGTLSRVDLGYLMNLPRTS